MNPNNEPEQTGQNNEADIPEENYNTLISELSRECLRLETENAELARRLKNQPSAADQRQSKADTTAFVRLIQENQARR